VFRGGILTRRRASSRCGASGAASGSILFVVIEPLAVARKLALEEITTWGILLGVTAGFLTDAIVTAPPARDGRLTDPSTITLVLTRSYYSDHRPCFLCRVEPGRSWQCNTS
jgi:hypothetical protein